MSITIKEVEHVANLARLELNEDEKEKYAKSLSDILKFAEKLNELDTDHVEPTSHPLALTNVLREDEARPSIPREAALRNAPDEQDGQFKVPAVLE